MLLSFFSTVRRYGVPASTRELLDCLKLLSVGFAQFNTAEFYQISRLSLVKDEKLYDRFDRAFSDFLDGVNTLEALPEFENFEQTMREVLSSKQAILELEKRLLEYQKRQQEESERQRDSSRAPGDGRDLEEPRDEEALESQDQNNNTTDETESAEKVESGEGEESGDSGEESGDGESGEEGEDGEGEKGERGEKGQGVDGDEGDGESEKGIAGTKETFDNSSRRASDLWTLRRFEALDEEVELGTRNLKVALRRIRKFARTGAVPELDLDATIRNTARNAGLLDVVEVPERRNSVKVLLFLDIGGSMDEHVLLSEQLFAAAKYEFKYLECFYFHNFLYEKVWTDVTREAEHAVKTLDLFHKYSSDYKVIFVGDADMARHEVTDRGGSVEHFNAVAGQVWFEDLRRHFKRVVWLNPTGEDKWQNSYTTVMIKRLLENEMYPLNVAGIDLAARSLVR